MPVVNDGLEHELGYIENPDEQRHIRALWDTADPLMQEISHCLIQGKNNDVDHLTRKALDDGFSASTIMDDGLIAGMAVVGIKFRDNIIFVPEVLVAARAMKAGMAYIEPILSESGVEPIGTVVMGTVKGDLHDIGKNLCIMMLRGAGFVVHDLGVDTQPEEFIDEVADKGADILGMSALLTTTMPNMGRTIDAFEEAGLRSLVRIMVGGAPLSQEFADDMGADGYGKDAMACVDLAREFVRSSGIQDPVAAGCPWLTPTAKWTRNGTGAAWNASTKSSKAFPIRSTKFPPGAVPTKTPKTAAPPSSAAATRTAPFPPANSTSASAATTSITAPLGRRRGGFAKPVRSS